MSITAMRSEVDQLRELCAQHQQIMVLGHKDDVREMVAGQECGIGLEHFEGFEPGDIMETYRLELEEI